MRARLHRLAGHRLVVAASVVTFGVALAVIGAYLIALHTAQSQVTSARQQAARQEQQGQVLEAKLCTTLDRLAALKPPAGNPAANPSRAFDDELHAVLAELGPDLGCR